MNTSSQSERGSIVVVLLVLLTLLGLGVTSLFLTTSSVRVATNIKLTNDARVVAESGLERARDILLSDPTSVPLATLLVGSGIPADEVPHDATRCLGEARGAVLVDFRDAHKVSLLDVDFPTIDRRSDLPAGAGNVVPQTLGHYTVYVRQDLADCRMGNFTCDFAAGTDSRVCEPPAGSPQPNHYVVVRSEGVAADGKSRDFAEATYFLGGTTLPGEPGGDAGVGPGIDAGSSSSAGGGSGGAGGVGGSGGTGGVGGATSTFPAPCLSYAVTAVAGCSGGWFKGCITINSSSLVDSFSSEVGPYGYSNKGAASIAMTCSKAAATSSCPNNCPSGCITGTVVYGQPSTFDASTIPVPAHVLNSNHVTVPSNVTLSPATPDTVTYYEEVDVNTGGTLTLEAGRYVVDRLNLNQGGTLYVDDDHGAVVVWVLSNLSPSSTVVVKSGKAENFWLIYDGTSDVNNNSTNNFTGVIFAPAAAVNLNYVVTGAVVGGRVTLNSPSRVHFDVSLRCP